MSSKFTCRFCKEQFDVPKGLYKHLQSAHTAGPSRDNRTCPICGVLCLKYEGYRDHLLYIHGQTDEGLKLAFKSLNEFLVWKAELELKHNCKYVLQSSPKVLPSKEKKYFYQCDRSDSKDKRDKKSVVMKTCSSVISVVEGINVFKVEYWDTHSGHSQTSSTHSLQNELEAAISSVEMVNAIADSDDSYDRSENILASGNSSPSASNIEKQSLIMKSNSTSSVNKLSNSSLGKKYNATKPSNLVDSPKKKNSNTILYSLASVACGKGIKRKTSIKTEEKKNNSKTGSEDSKSGIKQVAEIPLSVPEPQKGDPTSIVPVTVAPPKHPPILSPKTVATSSISTSLSGATKTVSSGLPAIAPKITSTTAISSASYATINSLINSNSAFSNQLVIVNPVGMDQNSLNSKQNVLSGGQNILFSLGSSGQNIVPAVTQSINVVSAGEKKAPVSNNAKKAKLDSPKITSSSVVSKSILKSNVSSVASTSSSTAPVTLKSGLSNSPVILSSLPIGSTFMSVNNNLIPIATPSGTFLPTSLPPNIVLTPVVSSTSVSGSNSTQKSTRNSLTITKTVSSNQSQSHYTPSSTVAVTVSSIVKEPIYYSSAVKQVSRTVASSSMPISSASSLKTYAKNQNKSVPATISGKISPLKNASKFMTSTPVKSNLRANENSFNKNKSQIASSVNKPVPNLMSKLINNVPSNKGKSFISDSSVLPTVTVSSISSPKNRISARKRINSSVKSKPSKISTNNLTSTVVSSPGITQVVNSQLNLAPISSTVTPQHMDVSKSGTLLFESSGDVYMIEPMEDAVQTKRLEASTKKVDRSMQTTEICFPNLKSKIQRKRAASVNEDSAVMLKVKCYQLEMKYLNILAECKRLKVELTKERLKNAELSGEKAPDTSEEGMAPDTSRSKASEIMKEIEESFSEKSDVNIYTMTKTSVLRSLYEDLEELCMENTELNKELENYRTHDKFYKSLKKKLFDEEF